MSDSETPWTIAYQAPPSMGFSRQEYWSGLPFPSPGYLPNSGIEPGSPTLQEDALTSEPPGKPTVTYSRCQFCQFTRKCLCSVWCWRSHSGNHQQVELLGWKLQEALPLLCRGWLWCRLLMGHFGSPSNAFSFCMVSDHRQPFLKTFLLSRIA